MQKVEVGTGSLLAVVIFCAAASTAASAQAPGSGPTTVFDEELTITGRAVGTPGGSVRILDRATIEAAGAGNAAELVRLLAGVHVPGSGSRGSRLIARVRGGDPNFTLVLVDGVPLNDPTDLEGGTFNLASLPTDQIERVELISGPNSFYFGSSAMAGAINFVTRRGGGPSRVEAQLEAGDHSLRRGNASISGGADGADWFFGTGFDEEAGRLVDDRFEQLYVQGNAGWKLGERARLRVTGRFTDWESDDYPEASGGPVFGSGELRRSSHEQLSLSAVTDLRGGDWKQSAALAYTRQATDRESPAIFPQVPPIAESRRYTRARASYLARLDRWRGIEISGGVDVDRESGDNDSALLLPAFLGGPISGDYDLDRTTAGGFGELAIERGRARVELGLRADLPEDHGTAWSPRAAISWRPAQRGLLLRTSWSQAFKLPSLFALASPPQLGGNPDLKPERSTGLDAAVEFERASGDLGGGVAIFSNVYKELIDFDFEQFRNRNLARVEADGIEVYLEARPAERLTLRADWTVQDVEAVGESRPPLHHPESFGSLRVDWRPREAISLYLEGRRVGGSFDEQIPVADRDRVDAYETFAAALSWRWAAAWRLTARLDNLTDSRYENFIGFPEPGRSLRFGLGYRTP